MCRRHGLETKRRCGWRAGAAAGPARAVWNHGKVTTEVCPKSYITARSLEWIEEFHAWKVFGATDARTLTARQVEAFLTLENELGTENSHGE